MGRTILGLGLLFSAVGTAGCSDNGSPGGGTGGATTSTGGASTGSGGSASSTGGSTSMGGGSTGGNGTVYTESGVCGERGQGTATATTFEGFEEFYLIGEKGFGSDICVVRFDVKRVGAAPDGCTDCKWSHQVEFSNPTVVTDVDGVCGKSELGFDAAKISATQGSKAAYGYVSQFVGHNSVLMKYGETSKMWDAYGNATWEEASGAFRFDRRNGACGY
jgi:hypothetical protein